MSKPPHLKLPPFVSGSKPAGSSSSDIKQVNISNNAQGRQTSVVKPLAQVCTQIQSQAIMQSIALLSKHEFLPMLNAPETWKNELIDQNDSLTNVSASLPLITSQTLRIVPVSQICLSKLLYSSTTFSSKECIPLWITQSIQNHLENSFFKQISQQFSLSKDMLYEQFNQRLNNKQVIQVLPECHYDIIPLFYIPHRLHFCPILRDVDAITHWLTILSILEQFHTFLASSQYMNNSYKLPSNSITTTLKSDNTNINNINFLWERSWCTIIFSSSFSSCGRTSLFATLLQRCAQMITFGDSIVNLFATFVNTNLKQLPMQEMLLNSFCSSCCEVYYPAHNQYIMKHYNDCYNNYSNCSCTAEMKSLQQTQVYAIIIAIRRAIYDFYIECLHRYNSYRDVCTNILGWLSLQQNMPIEQLYEQFLSPELQARNFQERNL